MYRTVTDDDSQWRKGKARLNRTVGAFVARGVDVAIAKRLQEAGSTLNILKQKSLQELAALGIPNHAAENILKEVRPPIPFRDLARVLIANRLTCCVCRDHGRSVVVHHITPWAKSRDHSTTNLAVLCLDDHDRAHKTGGLTQNLTPKLVHEFKATWEQTVGHMDAKAVLEASAVDSDCWWLFNHVRLHELAVNLGINLNEVSGHRQLYTAGIIEENGTPVSHGRRRSGWIYEGEHCIALYAHGRGVLNAVLERLTVLNISDDLDRGFLAAVVKQGDFLVLQGSIVFKSTVPRKNGPGQSLIGTRKANGVEIFFPADRWEATSNSARACWLSGRQNAICLLRVMSIDDGGSRLRIGATALAIGAGLPGLRTREYANAPYRAGYFTWGEDDESEDDWDKDELLDSESNSEKPAN